MRIGRLPRPSIARPPAAAGKQFGLRAEVIVIAVARPVAMAIILFPACRRADGQWPPLRVQYFLRYGHFENGKITTIANLTGRVPAIAKTLILKPNSSPAAAGRAEAI